MIFLDLLLICYLFVNPPRKKITLAGSSTVFPLAQRWAGLYMEYMDGVSVEVTGGGSGMGILAAAKNTVDIGMSSHPLECEHKTAFPDLTEIAVALDGVAIVANKNINESLSLTREMVVSIFSGKIRLWEDFERVFGVEINAEGEIVVCVRADKSGTTEVFSKWLSLDPSWSLGYGEVISWPKISSFVSGNGNQEVLINVRNNPNAIGYVGLAFAREDLVAVAKIRNPTTDEFVLPNPDTVKNAAMRNISSMNASLFDTNYSNAYPITRALYFVVDVDFIVKKKHVLEFIAWVLDPDGGQNSDIVRDVGYVELAGTKLHTLALSFIFGLLGE
ncbi:MAG: PstS family phosphate ABC transporter substrate-binding protein [Candidatus Njordarchaeota archaeon]